MLGRADVLEDRLLLASVERHEGHVQHLEDARKGSGNGLVADVVLVVVGPGEVDQIRANTRFGLTIDLFPEKTDVTDSTKSDTGVRTRYSVNAT